MESNVISYIEEQIRYFEGQIPHISNFQNKSETIKKLYFSEGENLLNIGKKTKSENNKLELIVKWEYLAIQNSNLLFNNENVFDKNTKILLLYPIKTETNFSLQEEISFYVFKFLLYLIKGKINSKELIAFIQANLKSFYNCLRVKFLKKNFAGVNLRNNIFLFNYYTDQAVFDEKAKNPIKHRQMFFLMINELMKQLNQNDIEKFINVLLDEDELFQGNLKEIDQELNESRMFIIECLLGNIKENNEELKKKIIEQFTKTLDSTYIVLKVRGFHVFTSLIMKFPNDIINNSDLYEQIVETKDESNETLQVLGYFAISLLYESLKQNKLSDIIDENFIANFNDFYNGYFDKKCSFAHYNEANLIKLTKFFNLETKIQKNNFIVYNLFLQQYQFPESYSIYMSSFVDDILFMINDSKDDDLNYEFTLISLCYVIEKKINDFQPNQNLYKKIEPIFNTLKTETNEKKKRCLYLVLFSLGMRLSTQNVISINNNYKDIISSFSEQKALFHFIEFLSFWIILFEGKNLNISQEDLNKYFEIIDEIQYLFDSFEDNIVLFAIGLLMQAGQNEVNCKKTINDLLHKEIGVEDKITFSEMINDTEKIKIKMVFNDKWNNIVANFLKLKIEKNKEILNYIKEKMNLELNKAQQTKLLDISNTLN